MQLRLANYERTERERVREREREFDTIAFYSLENYGSEVYRLTSGVVNPTLFWYN